MADRARLAVLVSGSGTNLQAILDACARTSDPNGGDPVEGPSLDADVVAVIANNPDAYALERARRAGVATTILPHVTAEGEARPRAEYDTELAYEVSIVGADLVVLAGWNRVLTEAFLAHHTVINLHPAKPGAFPGLGAIEKAYRAWERGEVTSGGVMVHYVPDEGVDSGPVIAWEEIPFEPGESLDDYENRVHRIEHKILVESVEIALRARPPVL